MKFFALTSALLVSASALAGVDFHGTTKLDAPLTLTNKKNVQTFTGMISTRFSLKDSKKVTINFNNNNNTEYSFDLDRGQRILDNYPTNGPYNGGFSSLMRGQHAPRGVPIRNLKVEGNLSTDLRFGPEREKFEACSEWGTIVRIDPICVQRRENFRIQNRYLMSPRDLARHRDADAIECRVVTRELLPGDRLVIDQVYAQFVTAEIDLIDPMTGIGLGRFDGTAREDEYRVVYRGDCVTEADLQIRRRYHYERDNYRNRRRNPVTIR